MSRATLLLCHRLPFPPNKGDKIRSFALLKHLAARGKVHLACFIDDPEDFKYRDEVRKLAGGNCLFVPVGPAARWLSAGHALLSNQPITTAFYSSRAVSRWLAALFVSERPDNIVIFGSAMAPYLLGDKAYGGRVLFDMVDVDSDKWRQYAAASRGVSRWIFAREARAVFRLEREATHVFGQTLLASPYEAKTFRRMVPECADKIATMNNGVDFAYFAPGTFDNPFPNSELAIVMTGRMNYRPNVDGAKWFVDHVVPRLCEKVPEAHIYFVGSNPLAALRRLSGPRVTVTGAVEDIRPYLQAAAVVVAPLLIARGVQNKVLEAMAMQKPVVATEEATRALNIESGVHLWVENDPARFADAIVTAVQSPARVTVMERARKYVEQNHDWKLIFRGLDEVLERLATDSIARNSAAGRCGPGVAAMSLASDITGAQA